MPFFDFAPRTRLEVRLRRNRPRLAVDPGGGDPSAGPPPRPATPSRPTLALALAAATCAASPLGAQDTAGALAGLTPAHAELFVTPLVDGLGRALSTGLVPTLRSQGAFQLTIGLRAVAARIPESGRSFQPVPPSSVTFRGTVHTDPFQGGGVSPTIAGRADPGATLAPRPGSSFEAALRAAGEDPADFVLALPAGRGLDVPWVPLVEATLGLGLGTDLVARFAPTVAWDEALGDASVFGVTVLHALDRWVGLAASPLDLRLTGSLQRIRAGGYLEEVATAAGLVAGISLGGSQLYVHGRMEDVRATVRRRISNPAGNPALLPHGSLVEQALARDARARVGVGAVLRLAPFVLDAEVSPGGGGALALRLSLAPPRPPNAGR